MPHDAWTWLAAAAGGLTLALSLAGMLARIVLAELKGRLARAERRLDEVHLRFARRDDLARELEAIRAAFAEVFAELRRANEGIAALRGGAEREG